MADATLPDYEPMLAAYHEAFAVELEAMVRSLPISEGSLVLEMACGDGAYTPWLVDLAGPSGRVVGLDVSRSYLELARKAVDDHRDPPHAEFLAASIDRLPFPDRTFDAVWCAQSLFSLPEPLDSVRRMSGVVKSGGLVAVLEDDTLHQVILPWPVDIELAVRKAEWECLRDESRHPRKFYVGRRLVGVFRRAGLVDVRLRSFATSQIAPLESSTRRYLELYLQGLGEKVSGRIDPAVLERFLPLTDPASGEFLLDQEDFQVTVLDQVVHGRIA